MNKDDKNNKSNIIAEINLCNIKLKDLEEQLPNSKDANIIYNKILIKKAVLANSLKSSNTSLMEKLSKIFNKSSDKKICDYFHS